MQGQSGNHYKLAKSISDLPDWAYDSTNGLKYISIQDYKYPISLILDYDKDMVERGEVKYYSNPGHTGYEGMKCDPKVGILENIMDVSIMWIELIQRIYVIIYTVCQKLLIMIYI